MTFDRQAWKTEALMAGSHNRAAVIASLAQYDLDPEMLRELLAEEWPMVDGSRGYQKEILSLFHEAGFTTDQDGFTVNDLPADDEGYIEIFRGNVGEDPRSGFSWTLDRKRAEFFASAPFGLRAQLLGYGAHREDGEEPVASVWGTWVSVDDVLGYFDGRGEKEVIVDGASLWYPPTLVAQAVSADG